MKSIGIKKNEKNQTGGRKIAKMQGCQQVVSSVQSEAMFAEEKLPRKYYGGSESRHQFDGRKDVGKVDAGLPETEVKTLDPLHSCQDISGDVCDTCRKLVSANKCLKFRHGTNLLLRNIIWKVREENITQAKLGRRILKSIGATTGEYKTP